jgi:hypothetical protein
MFCCFSSRHNNINKRANKKNISNNNKLNSQNKGRESFFLYNFGIFPTQHNNNKKAEKEATRTEGEEKFECFLRPSVRL